MLDNELSKLSHQELIAEVIKLRNGIREHRDSTGHELCWHHPKLWDLLPEKTDPKLPYPNGPNLCRDVYIIADHWMSNNRMRRG